MKLRFTIRDLLWLTAVAALAVAWWLSRADNQRLKSDIKSLTNELAMMQSLSRLRVVPVPGTLKDMRSASIRDQSVEQAMQVERLQTHRNSSLFRTR